MIRSFEWKPLRPITVGMPAPAIARQPMSIVSAVMGIFFRSPPICGISFVPQA